MKIAHRYLHWESSPEIIQPVKRILDKYNIKYKYKEDLETVISTFRFKIEFYLYEGTNNFKELKDEITKTGLLPQIIGSEYEKEDFAKAEWFVIDCGGSQYPQPEDTYLEATFNLHSHCHSCGMGKIQDAPFRLRTPKQNNLHFVGLHWEYEAMFVKPESKKILEVENIKNISFSKPVLNRKNIDIEVLDQVHIQTVLDKGFDSYNTNIITCKLNNEEDCNKDESKFYCGKIKYHHPKVGGYVFDKNIFNSNFDIALTNEYFGSGGSANRLKIVSKRFKELVEKHNLKGLYFYPIFHERIIK